jgi:hypothetical protein
MVIQLGMAEDDLRTDQRRENGAAPHQDLVVAENVSLRILLAQAEINARSLLAKAGIDARERETSDRLQKLILEGAAPLDQEYARYRRRHRRPEPA